MSQVCAMTPLHRATMEAYVLTDGLINKMRMRLADKAVENFHVFFEHFAWPVLEPATKFMDNWHIHAMCEHLEAVTRGDIRRLLINIPFRSLKSRIVSQAWPAWEWLRRPHLQYLTASYARDLAVRDAVDARRIINSMLYQACWKDRFQMTSDQDVKTRYENSKRGMRVVSSTDSAATGFGGNRVIIDDPQSTEQADNELARQASIDFWKGTASTRFNDPKNDAAVVVQQRLNVMDLSGYLLESEAGVWDHLVFPMEYESKRLVYMGGKMQELSPKDTPTSIGYVDPRNEEGELLNPRRIDDKTLAGIKLSVGQYHTDAQLQQRPSSRGGVIFKRGLWNFYRELPQLDEVILSADCAFKDTKTSDNVAIHVWGRSGPRMYLLKRTCEKMGFGATVVALRAMSYLYPQHTAILVEDKANGSAVIETLRLELTGVIAIEPEGGKVARAFACQPTHEAGNLWLPDPSIAPDIEQFISETASFPSVPHDDDTDAFTQAVNWMRTRITNDGFISHMAAMLAATQQSKETTQ